MNKSSKAIFWVIVFFCMLLAVDQFMLRVESKSGGLQAAQEFYLDFRQRLIGLGASGPESVEEVLVEKEPTAVVKVEGDNPRYLYADENGQLQFADSMEDIPPEFRKGAERMDE